MIKNSILILLVLFSLSAESQIYNRNSRMDRRLTAPQQTRQDNKIPEFQPLRFVGLVIYDADKVVKKIGVRKKPDVKKVKEVIAKYNSIFNDIKRINTFTFNDIKLTVEATQKKAIKTQDYSSIEKVQKKMMDAFKPIIAEIDRQDKSFDTEMKAVLSKKQYKKWEKYKSKRKKKAGK